MCTLHNQENMIKFHALIDYSTTSYTFIDEDHTCYHHLPLHLLKLPSNLTVINGGPVTSGVITHIVCIRLIIHNHQENIFLFITKLEHHPIVLRIT
jgi:hypothetical protein